MVEKPEENQNVDLHSKLIVVGLSYSRKFLFEISDGFKLLELLAKAIEVEESVGGGMRIRKTKIDDFNFSFLTKQRFREMILESIVEPEVKK